MSLVRTGHYWTWSLSWNDVENAFSIQGDYFPKLLDIGSEPYYKKFFKQVFKQFDGGDIDKAWRDTSMEWLQRALATQPDVMEANWRTWAAAVAAGLTNPASMEAEEYRRVVEVIESHAPPTVRDAMLEDVEQGNAFLGTLSFGSTLDFAKVAAVVPHSALQNADLRDIRVFAWLDDREESREQSGFRHAWNGFLRLFNLFQFLDKSWFVTSSSVDEFDWSELVGTALEPDQLSWERVWSDARDDAFPEYDAVLSTAWDAGIREEPTRGYELISESGRPLGPVAEIAWLDAKVGILDAPEDDPYFEEDRDMFENEGWSVLLGADVLEDPSILISELEGDV
jgi:hypothetical protein